MADQVPGRQPLPVKPDASALVIDDVTINLMRGTVDFHVTETHGRGTARHAVTECSLDELGIAEVGEIRAGVARGLVERIGAGVPVTLAPNVAALLAPMR